MIKEPRLPPSKFLSSLFLPPISARHSFTSFSAALFSVASPRPTSSPCIDAPFPQPIMSDDVVFDPEFWDQWMRDFGQQDAGNG
jgi:hypothetical protein